MTKINVSEDCGNAPKKRFLRDFTIALAQGDIEDALQAMSNDIRWNQVGDKVLTGNEEAKAELQQMAATKSKELTIVNVITHGNTGAVDGTILLDNGKSFAFCGVFRFNSAKDSKIKELTSYLIPIK